MTGINHRRKNPVYRAPSSHAAKVAQLRHSHRAFQKKPFSPRKAVKEEKSVQEVMGRRVFSGREDGESVRTGRKATAASGSSGRHFGVTLAQAELGNHSIPDDHNKRNDADMTVEQLLQEANLAGLPERFRKHSDPAVERDCTPMSDRDDDGDDDIFESENNSVTELPSGMEEGCSQSSEAPLMVYPSRNRSIPISSAVQQAIPLIYSPHSPPLVKPVSIDNLNAAEGMPATSQTHDQHLQLVRSDLSPSTSEPWKETGTISSRSNGFAEEFEDPRNRWSDAEEDVRMLDCSNDGEEGRNELGRQGKDLEEAGGAFHASTSINDAAIPREFQGQTDEQPRMAYDEISRFFASTTATPADFTQDALAVPKNQKSTSLDVLSAFERSSSTALRAQPLNAMLMPSQDSARDGAGDAVDLFLPDDQQVNERIGTSPGTPMHVHHWPTPGLTKQRRVILNLSSSSSPITSSRAAEYQTRTLVERFPAFPARPDAEIALCSQAAAIAWIPSISSRTVQRLDGPTSGFRWDATAKRAKHENDDTDIESFGSLRSHGRDIEAEAFEIVSDGMRGDSDGEIAEDGEDGDEAIFEPRLIRNHRPQETWEISPRNDSEALASGMQWCQQNFPRDELHLERRNDPQRRSARLALNASKTNWLRLWAQSRNMREALPQVDDNERPRITVSPEEWDLSDGSTQADLELLGEDGLPYVFEAVANEVTAITDDQPSVPVTAPGAEGGDDSGVLLRPSPTPFLEHVDGMTSQNLDQSRLNLPSISDVTVVYNYPNDVGATTEAEAGVGRPQELKFTEAMILQDIRAYFEGLAKTLACDEKGDPE